MLELNTSRPLSGPLGTDRSVPAPAARYRPVPATRRSRAERSRQPTPERGERSRRPQRAEAITDLLI
jgi:hypothetical protein